MVNSHAAAELWELRNADGHARCVAAVHPRGLELRYFMNGHPLIARVFDTWEGLVTQARLWRAGLEARGWHDASADDVPIRQSA
jgi:hypothetical protein